MSQTNATSEFADQAEAEEEGATRSDLEAAFGGMAGDAAADETCGDAVASSPP
jgi:hypothetical protein